MSFHITAGAATEPDETFTLTVAVIGGGTVEDLGAPATATATQLDDDAPPYLVREL